MERFRTQRRDQMVSRLREALGRGDGVTGLADVVEVLRRGQVAELVIAEDGAGIPAPLAARELWVGDDALAIAMRRSEIVGLGAEPRRVRADIAVLRAAVAQDAGVTFAPGGRGADGGRRRRGAALDRPGNPARRCSELRRRTVDRRSRV